MRKQALIASYLDQTLTGPGGVPLSPGDGFVFGTATPRGSTEWEKLHDRQSRMLTRLMEAGFTAHPAYATGFLRSFVEPVVLGQDMTMADALAFAESMELDLFLELRLHAVHVVKKDGTWIAEAPLRRPDDIDACVMPNTDPSEVCYMAGGPYGSRAISASLDWSRERTRLIAAFGCATCQQGKHYRMKAAGAEGMLFTSGGPIGLVPHEVPTRFTVNLEVSRG